jgi:hypothetical protein
MGKTFPEDDDKTRKRHILSRSYLRFETGYALENKMVFELAGMLA